MKLSVVIPCYNEAKTIGQLIAAVRDADLGDYEIIVVDDGSSDGTRELLQGPLAETVERVILHPQNQGKGAAVRSGFEAASGDVLIIQDADLEYDPRDIHVLLRPVLEGKADVVFGSRFMGSGPHRVVYFWHMVGNRFLTLLSNMLTDINLTDMETCYKLIRRSVWEQISIEEDRFGVEPELTAKIARTGCRIFEVGISYNGRTYAEGKKIGWRDGIRALYAILKYNLWKRQKRKR